MTELKRRSFVSSQCTDLRGQVYCGVFLLSHAGEPELVDQLILTLGLGSSGHHILSPAGSPGDTVSVITSAILPSPPLNLTQRFTRSDCDDSQQVCHHLTNPRGIFTRV